MLFAGRSLVSTHLCCELGPTSPGRGLTGERIAGGDPQSRMLAQRCFEAAGWIVPSGILALLPKCPACLAAYVAIGTGIGISTSAALHLRVALVALCVASLAYLSTRRGGRFIGQFVRWRKSSFGMNRRLRSALYHKP